MYFISWKTQFCIRTKNIKVTAKLYAKTLQPKLVAVFPLRVSFINTWVLSLIRQMSSLQRS